MATSTDIDPFLASIDIFHYIPVAWQVFIYKVSFDLEQWERWIPTTATHERLFGAGVEVEGKEEEDPELLVNPQVTKLPESFTINVFQSR